MATVVGEPIDEDRIYKVGSVRDICRASDGATIGPLQYITFVILI